MRAVIESLTVRHFGRIDALELTFDGTLNVVTRCPFREELYYALLTVLNSRATLPEGMLPHKEDACLQATVTVEKIPYFVCATPKRGSDGFYLRAYDGEGTDRTEEYLSLSSHCAAQDAAGCFDGSDQSNALRLLACEWEEMHSGEVQRETNGYCLIGAFRSYLVSFIKNCSPERIWADKPYEIVLQGNGRYTARHPSADIHPCLSETEELLFRYLCFLRTVEFWHGFEKLRNLHGIKKPLLIFDFFERLDESVDAEALLRRAVDMDHQIIVFTDKDGICGR